MHTHLKADKQVSDAQNARVQGKPSPLKADQGQWGAEPNTAERFPFPVGASADTSVSAALFILPITKLMQGQDAEPGDNSGNSTNCPLHPRCGRRGGELSGPRKEQGTNPSVSSLPDANAAQGKEPEWLTPPECSYLRVKSQQQPGNSSEPPSPQHTQAAKHPAELPLHGCSTSRQCEHTAVTLWDPSETPHAPASPPALGTWARGLGGSGLERKETKAKGTLLYPSRTDQQGQLLQYSPRAL